MTISLAPVSITAPKKNAVVAAIAKNVAPAAKKAATPAKVKNAPATVAPAQNASPKAIVELHLPKGTERFTSASGIDWVRTPKAGAFQRWFQLAPKGTDETGIHSHRVAKDGTHILTIERARVSYRELKGAIKEIK